ncbi:hypothetical protein BKA57DRAFT_452855 [Linnemannia elongata]|nr:hypothetical protein BKA57DRAFT_452855 [Linnemannia elongata]
MVRFSFLAVSVVSLASYLARGIPLESQSQLIFDIDSSPPCRQGNDMCMLCTKYERCEKDEDCMDTCIDMCHNDTYCTKEPTPKCGTLRPTICYCWCF